MASKNIYYYQEPLHDISERKMQTLMSTYDGMCSIQGLAECFLDKITPQPERLRMFTAEERMMAKELQRIANENYEASRKKDKS